MKWQQYFFLQHARTSWSRSIDFLWIYCHIYIAENWTLWCRNLFPMINEPLKSADLIVQVWLCFGWYIERIWVKPEVPPFGQFHLKLLSHYVYETWCCVTSVTHMSNPEVYSRCLSSREICETSCTWCERMEPSLPFADLADLKLF